jgi:hypothetical protein
MWKERNILLPSVCVCVCERVRVRVSVRVRVCVVVVMQVVEGDVTDSSLQCYILRDNINNGFEEGVDTFQSWNHHSQNVYKSGFKSSIIFQYAFQEST